MKKAIILASIVAATGVLSGGVYMATAPQVSVAQEEIYEIGPPAYINDIKVPYEVLQYVHSAFPAHAVVEAKKVKIENNNGYRLVISRDSKAKEKTHIYFTDKWEIIKEEEVFANKQKSVAPKPAEPEVRQSAPESEPQTRTQRPESRSSRPLRPIQPTPEPEEQPDTDDETAVSESSDTGE